MKKILKLIDFFFVINNASSKMRRNANGLEFYFRAACLQRLGCAEFALTDLDLAQENGYQESNMFKLWDRRGQCLITLRRFKEARVAFEEALSSVKVAKLDKKKREKFLKDVQNSFQKIGNEEDLEHIIKPDDKNHELLTIGEH